MRMANLRLNTDPERPHSISWRPGESPAKSLNMCPRKGYRRRQTHEVYQNVPPSQSSNHLFELRMISGHNNNVA